MNIKAQVALRRGETLELDGILFKMDGDGTVREGDLYIAERNSGPKLLTAKRIDIENGWIVPVDRYAYPYNIGECVKVKEARQS